MIRDPVTEAWRIDQGKPVVVDPDIPDEQCVPFVCGLVTAALCIDLLRNEGRHLGNAEMVRAYVRRGEGKWTRLPYAATLTKTGNGTITLNERWFPIHEEPEPIVVKQSSFVFRGRRG